MNPRATFVLATLCFAGAAFAQSVPAAPEPPTAHDGLSNAERNCMQFRDQGVRARCLERAAPSYGASDAARTCRDLPSRAAQARCLDRLSPGAGSPSAEPRPAPQGVPPAEIIEPGGAGVIRNAPPQATPIK